MPVQLIIVGLIVLTLVLVIANALSPKRRLKSALAKLPRVDIADAKDHAPCKILGKVATAGGESMRAPLSGRACVYYQVKVEEHRDRNNNRWVTVINEQNGVDFRLSDGTGQALVKMTQEGFRQVLLHSDAHFRSGMFNDATPELEAFLGRHGRTSTGWVFNKNIRYSEGVIEEGEEIVAAGAGRWETDRSPGAGGGYRDSARVLVVEPPAGGSLIVSDDPDIVQSPEATERSAT